MALMGLAAARTHEAGANFHARCRGIAASVAGSVPPTAFLDSSLSTRGTPADRPSLKRSPKLFSQITLLPGAEASSNNARSAFSGMRRPGFLRW